MGRDSYDDMQEVPTPPRRPRRSESSVILLVVMVCIIATVGLLFFGWNRVFPPEEIEPVTPVIYTPSVEKVAEAPALPAEEIPVPQKSEVAQTAEEPLFREYTVEEGDSILSIAEKFGLSAETITSANNIFNVNAPIQGCVLKIPETDGTLYTVKEGDTLLSVAGHYGVDVRDLKRVNRLESETLEPEQQLFIPAGIPFSLSLAKRPPIKFTIPSDGEIVVHHNQISDDPVDTGRCSGIVIETPVPMAVRASAAGNVVDAGMKRDGLGRFVVIAHQDGYRTTYAHLESVDVYNGQAVQQDQIIGSTGTSGTDFTTPRLYYTLEQNGIYYNPEDLF